MRQYVLVVEVDESLLDGDESIDNAAREVQQALTASGLDSITVRPLSEVIAC